MDGRLDIDQHAVKLLIGKRLISETTLERIEKLVVAFQDPIFHDEDPFYLIQFDDRIWVIPYFTEGVWDFLKSLSAHRGSDKLIYSAACVRMPFTWRCKSFGILPLFPFPRADCHSISSIPAWDEDGPFNFADVPDDIRFALL